MCVAMGQRFWGIESGAPMRDCMPSGLQGDCSRKYLMVNRGKYGLLHGQEDFLLAENKTRNLPMGLLHTTLKIRFLRNELLSYTLGLFVVCQHSDCPGMVTLLLCM